MREIIESAKRLWARVRAMEPAQLAEGVRALLVAAVTLGWVTIDDARTNAIVSAVAVVGSVLLTRKVRASVTPVAKLDGCGVVCEHDPGAAP